MPVDMLGPSEMMCEPGLVWLNVLALCVHHATRLGYPSEQLVQAYERLLGQLAMTPRGERASHFPFMMEL